MSDRAVIAVGSAPWQTRNDAGVLTPYRGGRSRPGSDAGLERDEGRVRASRVVRTLTPLEEGGLRAIRVCYAGGGSRWSKATRAAAKPSRVMVLFVVAGASKRAQ